MPPNLAVQAKHLKIAKQHLSDSFASTASFFYRHLFLFILLLLLCGNIYANSWTVLVYMAADNNLAYNAKLNLNQMESVQQPEGLKLIVQTDFPDEGAKRYRVISDADPQNFTSPVIQDLGVIDSGDPNTLQDFIHWGQNRYPNEHQMLIIWSHADSWYKDKWISPDYDSGSYIGVANGELKSALSGMEKVDILLFDACSMQSIEVLMEISDFADFVVASPDLVPDTGFPYPDIIPILSRNPVTVSSQIPQLYVDSYLPGGLNNPSSGYLIATCSTIRTDMLPGFTSRWKAFSTKIWARADELGLIRENLFEMNTGYADVDIRQLLTRLQADPNPFEGTQDLLSYWDEIVVASAYSLPWPESDIGTAAIWYPDIRYNYLAAWQHYMKLSFAKTGWLGIVNRALGNDVLAPEAPVLLDQEVILNKLVLKIAAPLSPDSLYYYVESDAGNHYVYPLAYASVFETSFFIEHSGNYQVYAIDRAGNKSLALEGDYLFNEPRSSITLYPNPVTDQHQAYLQWYYPDNAATEAWVEIHNLRGQRLGKHKLDISTAQTSGIINLHSLPGFASLRPAIYLISFKLGDKHFTKRMAIMY